MDELEQEQGIQARLIATLDKTTENRDILKQEFVQADALLKRVEPLLKDVYRASVEKEYDTNATNYAVQVALGAGYRKAIRDVYRLLYPEVTTNDQ